MLLFFTLFVACADAAAVFTNSSSSSSTVSSSSSSLSSSLRSSSSGKSSSSSTTISTSSKVSTASTMKITGITGPVPDDSDTYFRNPFMWLVLDYIPVANGTDPRNLSDPVVSAMHSQFTYCSALWESDKSVWAKTAVFSPTVASVTKRAVTTTSAAVPTGKANSNSSQAMEVAEMAAPKTFTQTYSGQARVFTWTASEPCCQSCYISGGSVDVFYWPTATQNPPVSTLVDAKGFTFTSPSIYVAFSSIRASNYCGDLALMNTAPTLAFNPGELSTSNGFWYDSAKYASTPITPYPAQYTEAKWGAAKCGMVTSTFWQLHGNQTQFSKYADAAEAASSHSSWYEASFPASLRTYNMDMTALVEQYTVSHDPCFPTLEIPNSRFTLTNKVNSKLTFCTGHFGFYDPPIALTRGSGFTSEAPPVATSAAPDLNGIKAPATSSVQPGSTPVPTTPAVTAQPQPTQTPKAESNEVLSPGTKGVSSSVDIPAPVPVKSDPPATSDSKPPPAPPVVNNPATSVQNVPAVTSQAPAPVTSANPIILTPVTHAAPTTQAPAQITVGSSTIIADPSSAFVIASQTLAAGGQVTHANSVFSLATDGSALVVAASSTQVLVNPGTPATTPAKITIAGSTITANPSSAFVIASQTLTPGGQITHSNSVYSLASDGAALVVAGSSTQNIAPSPAPSSPSAYVIGSQTLVAGSAATISGTVVSLQAGGSSVVVGGTTAPLSQYLAVPTSAIAGGQTQAPNSPVGAPAGSSGVAGIIASIGGFDTPSTMSSAGSSGTNNGSSNGTTMFLGSAASIGRSVWGVGFAALLGILGICIL